jgi:ABC-type amino acid transport substrate-binding protein
MPRRLAFLLVLALCLAPAAPAAGVPSAAPQPQKPLLVGVVTDPPFTYKDRTGNWSGLNVELWQMIARELGREFVLKEMPFKDILTALAAGEIDFSAATIYITEERERSFDFTTSFGSAPLGVAVRPDSDFHPWWAAMRIFFSWGTLQALGSLLLLLLLGGLAIWRIETRHNPDHFGGGRIKGIGTGVYWVGATMASGVCYGVPLKSLPGRLLGLLWMFACAVALSAFTASLASSLTTRHLFSNLLEQETLRQMRLGVVRDDVSQGIVNRLGARSRDYTEEAEAIEALLAREIDGFVFDEITLQYYASSEYRDKLSVLPTDLKRLPFAFGLPKDSPLRKPINAALLRIMDGPVWDSLLRHYGLAENFEPKDVVVRRKRR